jgi:hypothetical protein
VKKSFLGIIILVAVNCSSDQQPNTIMDQGQMTNYLIDLHMAEAAVQNLRLKADSAKIVFSAKEKQLLSKHQITDSVFINSYNYYLEHPIKLEEIYSAVVDSISLRQSLLNEAK